MWAVVVIHFLFCATLLLTFPNVLYSQSLDKTAQIFKQQADAVVVVMAISLKRNHLASGFIVNPDGLIVTSYHTLKGARKVGVKLRDGRVFDRVRIIKQSRQYDLALLKIDTKDLKYLALGDSDQLAIGQRVLTIGNPLGLESSVADGLVSAFREVNKIKLLQISVPLSEGSSGAPILDFKGQVVGITMGTLQAGQNLNFAIPVNYLKKFLVAVSSGRTRNQSPQIYIVKPKDTLFSIALRFQTNVSVLKRLNRLNSDTLSIGQRLVLPR